MIDTTLTTSLKRADFTIQIFILPSIFECKIHCVLRGDSMKSPEPRKLANGNYFYTVTFKRCQRTDNSIDRKRM